MAFGLRITVDARGASRKLKRVEKAARVTPILEAIGEGLVRFSRELFNTRGRAVGGWKPLAPNTVVSKGHSMPLIASGDLRTSIDYQVIPGARVQVGTDVPYAKYHQFGSRPHVIEPRRAKVLSFITTAGRVFARRVNHPGTPRRRFLANQTEAKRIAAEAARVYVKETLHGAD